MGTKDEARAAALSGGSGGIRFEVVEHNGQFFGARQMCPRIAKAVNKHKDDQQSRTVEMVIQITHAVVPVLGPDGQQVVEEVSTPVFEPVLSKDTNLPEVEPITDAKGRPIVIEGKAAMRAKMAPKLDADGKPVVKVESKPKFTLGERLFDAGFFDSFLEEPTDDGSFIGKIVAAASRVNDREDASASAKKR